MYGRGRQFEPIKRMKVMFVPGIKALTEDEANHVISDHPIVGVRCGGIGFIRISGTGESLWAVVECNSLILGKCPRHPTKELCLYKTPEKSMRNVRYAVFMRCCEDLGIPEDGNDNSCGYNIYPEYPLAKMREERTNPDPKLRPVIFEDVEKFAMEMRKRGVDPNKQGGGGSNSSNNGNNSVQSNSYVNIFQFS